MAQRCWVRISLAWVTPSPTNDIHHSCQGSCDRPQWRFLASTTTIRLSILAKVSDGEPSIGLMSATSTMSTPTLGNALNRVNSALPSCFSQVMNSGAYFFTNWVSWPEEEIIAKSDASHDQHQPKKGSECYSYDSQRFLSHPNSTLLIDHKNRNISPCRYMRLPASVDLYWFVFKHE